MNVVVFKLHTATKNIFSSKFRTRKVLQHAQNLGYPWRPTQASHFAIIQLVQDIDHFAIIQLVQETDHFAIIQLVQETDHFAIIQLVQERGHFSN